MCACLQIDFYTIYPPFVVLLFPLFSGGKARGKRLVISTAHLDLFFSRGQRLKKYFSAFIDYDKKRNRSRRSNTKKADRGKENEIRCFALPQISAFFRLFAAKAEKGKIGNDDDELVRMGRDKKKPNRRKKDFLSSTKNGEKEEEKTVFPKSMDRSTIRKLVFQW